MTQVVLLRTATELISRFATVRAQPLTPNTFFIPPEQRMLALVHSCVCMLLFHGSPVAVFCYS